MTVTIAPELNGAKLYVPGSDEMWLIIHGMRRLICGLEVYGALFSDGNELTAIDSLEHIQRGADLNAGTLLARAEGEDGIYLVTGEPESEVQKHLIATLPAFTTYGFDAAKVRSTPPLVLAGVPTGLSIV